LLGWYRLHRRELPWRDERDPYLIWVSEVMLQQTQVATVIDYYLRWLNRFPTLDDLAQASLEEVLEMWSGLGYYRRARFLHESSRRVAAEMGGRLPSAAGELKKLKGIGAYTAGAIASIAFGRPEPVVDGNVERVLSRLRAVEGDPKSGANQKIFWRLAARLVDPEEPGDFNQALMELGATVCTPQNPSCELCPVRQFCAAHELGAAGEFPATTKRARQRPVSVRSAVVVREGEGGDEFLLVKRPADGLLGGLWEFPSTEAPARADAEESSRMLHDYLGERFGLGRDGRIEARALGGFVHHFSHIRMSIEAEVWRMGVGESIDEPEQPVDEQSAQKQQVAQPVKWVAEDAVDSVAMSAAMRKVMGLYLARAM
jgi:A/G-specific adenine glycosylase